MPSEMSEQMYALPWEKDHAWCDLIRGVFCLLLLGVFSLAFKLAGHECS